MASNPDEDYHEGMAGGSAGMAVGRLGTDGGWRGMNGAQRRILASFIAGFIAVIMLILVANAESTISDLAASGASIPAHLIWSWEWSSMIGWLSLYPLLWWAVARFKPPQSSWPLAITLLIGGSIIASGWHITVMVMVRHVYYDATGNGPYRFFGVISDRLLYEFRKDVTTYVQFVAMAAVVQWLIARTAERRASSVVRNLTLQDGAIRYAIPIDEIDAIRAAGNYVEVVWGERTLLHRATLTAIQAELGDEFVRIHRAQVVRRDAIRRISSDKSGDFTVTLHNGSELRGSRRYRCVVESF